MRLINFETQRLINLEYQKLLQCQEKSVYELCKTNVEKS